MRVLSKFLLNDPFLSINENFFSLAYSRKDLSLKNAKIDILLITGMLSPYAGVVEKLHKDVDKEKVTMLKIERAGDVLADAVRKTHLFKLKKHLIFNYFFFAAR